MAITAPRVWLDGMVVDKAAATLPIMAHAPQRGSLVFDVGSFHRTERGVALFRAREHVARFLRSARIVGVEVGYGEDELIAAAADVVRASAAEEGLVRWSAFFAASEPDLVPREASAHVAVAVQRLEDAPRTKPLRVAVFPDARKAAPEALSPEAKAASAYLGPMLARRRAMAGGDEDVVLLDAHGNVAEAPIANVFVVTGGRLVTPPLGYILPGITRDAVLTLARERAMDVAEEPLPAESLAAADEAFLTATSMPILPIGFVNGRALPNAPGPITAALAGALRETMHARDPSHAAWSTPVD